MQLNINNYTIKIMSDKNNDEPDYRELYNKLLNESEKEIEELEAELRKPNIFNILEINEMEIRHSNFLKWLLDPNESHGLGNRFLIRVLRDLAMEKENDLDIVEISKLNFSNVEVRKEAPSYDKEKEKRGSMDLLIDFRDDKLVICIENKIWTKDATEQLEKYQTHIDSHFKEYDKRIFVYLTPFGDNPINYTGDKWHTYSYEKIITHLEYIQEATISSTIKTYISDYLTTLKSKIMGKDDKATALANAIYEQHKTIIDFIYDNRDSSIGYQQKWKEEYPWMFKSVEKFIALIQEADKNNKYNLGFTKNYISITRNGRRIYMLFSPNKSDQYSMEFYFGAGENEKEIREKIDALLKKDLNAHKTIKSEWDKDAKYFVITNFKDIVDNSHEIIKEIHKLRFKIDQ